MTTDENLDAVATQLGHLLIEFNALEIDMARLVARLLGQDDDVIIAIFAAELMFFARLKLARALVEAKLPELEQAAYLAALKRAEVCNTQRNQFIHSEYLPFVDSDDKLIEVLRAQHKKRPLMYAPGTDGRDFDKHLLVTEPVDIHALITEINSVALEVRVLAERYTDLHPTE